jgi:hypothetical protein
VSSFVINDAKIDYFEIKILIAFGLKIMLAVVREEHRRRMFENGVLRRIFGPKKDEMAGGWRKLHNEDLHKLYSSASTVRMIKSRRMIWAGNVARMGEKRNIYKILVGKAEVKKPLGRPRRRWVDNIKTDLKSDRMGCCGLD